MKKFFLFTTLINVLVFTYAQNPKVMWSDEFKLRKGSTDLDVLTTDNSGVYLSESHYVLKSYFLIGATMRVSSTLIKLDKNFAELYRSDFNDELKDKEFESFFVFENKIFILSSDYEKKDKTLTLFIAEVDKNSGKLSGEWHQLSSWTKEDKDDDINFKMSYNGDSTKMILVSNVQMSGKNTYKIQEFNKDFRITNSVNLSNEFENNTYQLEDVIYTTNDKIILVGRIYTYQEGKKKKSKYLDFSNYNIRIYDANGKQVKEINTQINGKWLVSSKMVQEKDKDLILAAFYSNEKKGDINGLLVQRINPDNGEILNTSDKEINTSLINTLDTTIEPDTDTKDNDDESKQERKAREALEKIKDESEAFSKDMRFRNILYTSDGVLILAEKYHTYVYTSQSYTPGTFGAMGTYSSTTYRVFESGDIFMCKIDLSGNISWLQILPKQQKEDMALSHNSGFGMGVGFGFAGYFETYNWPRYSGFGILQNQNTLNIFFNDNPKNIDVLQLGQPVKMASRFSVSDCFTATLNTQTGKFTRQLFFHNKDIPTAMPRLGSVINNEMYIIGQEARIFAKSKIALAKIFVSN